MRLSCDYVHWCTIIMSLIEMAPKTNGGKGKRSRKTRSAEPELPTDLSDIERPDGDDIEDDEVAAVNDTIVQYFEISPCYTPEKNYRVKSITPYIFFYKFKLFYIKIANECLNP